jgi:imidazoleglycerol-phosphate dehydratase
MNRVKSEENLGITIEKETPEEVAVRRLSQESSIRVRLLDAERDYLLKERIKTPYDFFNHMLETLAWRVCLNVEVDAKSQGYELGHVICEDTGWAMGAGFLHLFQQRVGRGVQGSGSGFGVMDEAGCRCILGFEGRALCLINWSIPVPEMVEGMPAHHLVAFWEGLAQGGAMTLHLDILKGRDPHHTWEAAFRALGESLRTALGPCPWRAGTTPGLKGF